MFGRLSESIYPAVRNKPAYRDKLANATCTICKNFPIEADEKFFCPIYKSIRYRTSKPPFLWGSKINTWLCMDPMTEEEYINLLEYKYLKKRELGRLWSRNHKAYYNRYYHANKWRARLKKKKYVSIHREQINAADRKYRRLRRLRLDVEKEELRYEGFIE